MSIYISGDIHGTLDAGKLTEYFNDPTKKFTTSDYLIICGDVAVCGFDRVDEQQTRKLLRELPVTVLFCDGNHENFAKLYSYSEQIWHGGKVHVIEPGIIHLMRGQIFEIDGHKFFVMGGACSVDRDSRIPGLTWFEEELPSQEEYEEAWQNLEKEDFSVDYVITHTAPYEVVTALDYGSFDDAVENTRELQRIADRIDFKEWFFGHFHEDTEVENFHCLFEEIIRL